MTFFEDLWNKAAGEPEPGKAVAETVRMLAFKRAFEFFSSLASVIYECRAATTDVEDEQVLRRALGLYVAAVRHAKRGGTVEFIDAQGARRFYKVPLR